VWDTAHMAEAERSQLQNLLADLVAKSDRTRDYFDARLRERLETTGKPLWDIERGKVKRPSPRVLRAIEEVLGLEPERLVDLVHPREDPPVAKSARPVAGARSDHPPVRTADGGETASVMRMDLSYAMGPGTNIDDDYIEGEPVELDIGFLRRLTPSAPSMLRLVSGIGDSMQPTIHDSEDLVLDLGQRVVNLQDRIWAISLLGAGAVKRLRTVAKDRVLVISDNPDVPDTEYSTEDIAIVGRIVGSIKRH